MTTLFPFSPATQLPYTFQPTLDGAVYNAVVTWDIFAQRPYINLFTLSGQLVFCLPLIGSEGAVNLSGLTWANGLVTATLDQSQRSSKRTYQAGMMLALTIKGAKPAAYNGSFQASVVTPNSFSYPLSPNPGPATSFGQVSFDISLTAGYFKSTLVYRLGQKQIEVNP